MSPAIPLRFFHRVYTEHWATILFLLTSDFYTCTYALKHFYFSLPRAEKLFQLSGNDNAPGIFCSFFLPLRLISLKTSSFLLSPFIFLFIFFSPSLLPSLFLSFWYLHTSPYRCSDRRLPTFNSIVIFYQLDSVFPTTKTCNS